MAVCFVTAVAGVAFLAFLVQATVVLASAYQIGLQSRQEAKESKSEF
jgi:hypothetical protein